MSCWRAAGGDFGPLMYSPTLAPRNTICNLNKWHVSSASWFFVVSIRSAIQLASNKRSSEIKSPLGFPGPLALTLLLKPGWKEIMPGFHSSMCLTTTAASLSIHRRKFIPHTHTQDSAVKTFLIKYIDLRTDAHTHSRWHVHAPCSLPRAINLPDSKCSPSTKGRKQLINMHETEEDRETERPRKMAK